MTCIISEKPYLSLDITIGLRHKESKVKSLRSKVVITFYLRLSTFVHYVPIVQLDRTQPCEGCNGGSSPPGGKFHQENILREECGSRAL